jgi:lipopolysaccharide/colanic/teichoic acid biosynthesis glycosyltransferase
MDVVLGSLALVAMSPLFLLVSLLIKLQSRGPVFYNSKRVGYKGMVFNCYKFRTMMQDADSMRGHYAHLNERHGILFKIAKDPRVTKIGAILRKYSVDELPQLWNVLCGEMSLVGPRPSIRSEVAQYKTAHLRRLDAVPGMTGLWQVEARRDPSFESYVRLDSEYVREWSIWLDLKIILRTANVVLKGTGT